MSCEADRPRACEWKMHRRTFVKSAVAAAGAGYMGATSHIRADDRQAAGKLPQPCLFSKPLGNRKAADLPAMLEKLGIDAVDLTCRPGGHVLPERVADDLPRVVERLQAAGVRVPMVTTAILDAGEPHAESIVKTVGELGIRYIKLGYFPYDMKDILGSLADAKAKVLDIAAMCARHNVHAGYHLHCGGRIGAALWDVHELLAGIPANSAGCYFDTRHATVEGGDRGWEIGLNLLAPRITMLAMKDFLWHKNDKGQWRPDDVPLGRGMVRHDAALRRLREIAFAGPVSLHVEYASPKTEVRTERDKQNLASIRRDWQTMREMLADAGFEPGKA